MARYTFTDRQHAEECLTVANSDISYYKRGLEACEKLKSDAENYLRIQLDETEMALVRGGKPVGAVMSLRKRTTGLGLKDAKDMVDAYRATLKTPICYG
jgi:ribosomal protein L7/L12